jgi:hypothetical protein
MKISVNLNDMCEVVLTEAGASHINAKRSDLYRKYPRLKPDVLPKAGDTYSAELWTLFNDFGEMKGGECLDQKQRCADCAVSPEESCTMGRTRFAITRTSGIASDCNRG